MSFIFDAIGTRWQIDIETPLSKQATTQLRKTILKRIEEFDTTYSRFRNDSLISQIAQQKGEYTFPPDANQLFSFYQTLYHITDGKVTPLIGQTLHDAGYDANYSLTPQTLLKKPPRWEDAMQFNTSVLKTKQPVLLDFGAAGKGYLIDIVAELLQQSGISSFVIDAGGDICHRNTTAKPITIGLENPFDTNQIIGTITVANESLCGSAGNRRAWKGFHHIIDPHILTSPGHITAVWVKAESTLIADGLTTCLFFVNPEQILNYFRYEYLILYKDFSIKKSANFQADLFTM